MPTIAKTLGGVDLNDGINTFWDDLIIPGTRLLQPATLTLHDGEVSMIRVDRGGLVMTGYMYFVQTDPAHDVTDFIRYLEDQTVAGGVFILGDGRKFQQCWAYNIVPTLVAKPLSLAPFLRVHKISMSIASRYTARVPA